MSKEKSSGGGGIGIAGVLGIVFVVLKLLGKIDWSWWWVTAPFWGPFALLIAIIVPFRMLTAVSGARYNNPSKRKSWER